MELVAIGLIAATLRLLPLLLAVAILSFIRIVRLIVLLLPLVAAIIAGYAVSSLMNWNVLPLEAIFGSIGLLMNLWLLFFPRVPNRDAPRGYDGTGLP